MGNSPYKDVSSLLSAFFDEEKRRQGGRYAEFFRGWKTIAGDRLASHSRVVDIDKGILIVEAEHPGWIQLLQMNQAQMLETARALFPEIGLRGIQFRLQAGAGAAGESGVRDAASPRPGPFGPEGREPIGGPPQAEEGRGGPASLDDIADPGLRALLGSLKKTVDGKE